MQAIGRALDLTDAKMLSQRTNDRSVELGGSDALVCNVSALAVQDFEEAPEKYFQVGTMLSGNTVEAAVP